MNFVFYLHHGFAGVPHSAKLNVTRGEEFWKVRHISNQINRQTHFECFSLCFYYRTLILQCICTYWPSLIYFSFAVYMFCTSQPWFIDLLSTHECTVPVLQYWIKLMIFIDQLPQLIFIMTFINMSNYIYNIHSAQCILFWY